MIFINAHPLIGGKIIWQLMDASGFEREEGVAVAFHTSSFDRPVQRREALRFMERAFTENKLEWITPGPKLWTIDLDALSAFEEVPHTDGFSGEARDLRALAWFRGIVALEPEFEQQETRLSGNLGPRFDARLVFYLTPKSVQEMEISMTAPAMIRDSLAKFRLDHPPTCKVAFIMMQFGSTKAHEAIVAGICAALSRNDAVEQRPPIGN